VLKSLKGTAAEFLEAVPNAIVVTDGDGRMVFINTTAESLLGYRPEECVGRTVEMLIPERFWRRHIDLVRHYHADARPRSMVAGKDLVARHKDGREIPVDIGLNPLPTDNGVLVIAAICDVSERLRAAEESEWLKDALLGTVSHELRSPISVIHGYATTALEYADRLSPAEFVQYFRDIDSAALRLERLVSDLLTMSRLDARAPRIDLQPTDIVPVVHEAVRTTGIAVRRREFRTSIESASIQVEGDAARLLEVLSNLLENADKFSPDGEPVEVSVEAVDQDLVTVSVRDRGPGVPPQELDAIFGRFYRCAAGGRTPVRGTGLGLAICKSIIDGHGGRIWASLPAGGGFRVTFSLRSVP
jgi:protein-histidine pros-kinase